MVLAHINIRRVDRGLWQWTYYQSADYLLSLNKGDWITGLERRCSTSGHGDRSWETSLKLRAKTHAIQCLGGKPTRK